MLNNIIQQELGNVLSDDYRNLISLLFGKPNTFSDIVANVEDMALEFGRIMLSSLLELADKAIRQSPRTQKEFCIKDYRVRTITTEMGNITFRRAYFRNRTTNEYCFLLDGLLGIEKYRRVDAKLRVKLCEFAADNSYQKTCDVYRNAVSKTSVMNFLREFKSYFENGIAVEETKDEIPKVLYIEADEDHVKYQDGSTHYEKMVFIHEGYEQVDKNHRRIINSHCIIGSFAEGDGNEALWDLLKCYINERYGKDAASKIKLYFTSDEGGWLKTCCKYLDVIQVIDKFHVVQACRRAVGGGFKWNSCNSLKKWVLSGDWKMVKLFKKVYLSDPTLSQKRKQSATTNFNYLIRNSENIDNIRNTDYHGDSTEAHISHWLADRDSSRPGVWSQEGLDSVMFFRCCKINGVDVYKEYVNESRREAKKTAAEKFDKRVTQSRKIKDKYAELVYRVASENPRVQAVISAIGDTKMTNA